MLRVFKVFRVFRVCRVAGWGREAGSGLYGFKGAGFTGFGVWGFGVQPTTP